ncbi:anhydro-N-acetylmuramic acid kinase [Labrys sp. KB_33_2]|uniref:anhydro-N-acetylmuramic acid kinase n=1 Tax=unclassified Labrys (in: a-proteobacteria) TaxID=2688601 RepID=UPI003EB990A2
MKTMMTALGLMSGTSMDGIDAALIETDGLDTVEMGPTVELAYSEEERTLLRRALADAVAVKSRNERPGALVAAERLITRKHADVVSDFLKAHDLSPDDIDVIGFHGQTVLHRPQERLTVQLGDGQALADSLGIRTVYDMRAADVAEGGQGAPLVPVYHQALVQAAKLAGPVAVLNLGGVGNVSYVAKGRDPIAFDTGPANALIDDLMMERTGVALDQDGRQALAGKVDENILGQLMAHPYFGEAPPKSLDRNAFSREAVADLPTPDAVATLAAFTARSAAAARQWLPAEPKLWIVCGGGARNPAILNFLRAETGVPVRTADEFGWSAAMMEAQAFAYLAARSLKELPLTFPSSTGVGKALTGGILAVPGQKRVGA